MLRSRYFLYFLLLFSLALAPVSAPALNCHFKQILNLVCRFFPVGSVTEPELVAAEVFLTEPEQHFLVGSGNYCYRKFVQYLNEVFSNFSLPSYVLANPNGLSSAFCNTTGQISSIKLLDESDIRRNLSLFVNPDLVRSVIF